MHSAIRCHDCEMEVKSGEKYAEYEAFGGAYYKCEGCFKKESMLRNFRPTEVYSRVVGYIRPVSQWNRGKQVEYADRKEFVANGCECV